MGEYAKATNVKVSKSRVEIEDTLSRYGASSFMYGWQKKNAIIAFEMHNRRIKFILPFPDKFDRIFTHSNKGRLRTKIQSNNAFEQSVRQKWRALSLVIKAKLEAVESGISVFEDEFLANIQLPDGSSVGEFMKPQIQMVYDKNQMPNLLEEK